MSETIYIGVDLGGTYVRSGAFTPDGQLLVSRQAEIEARQGPLAGLQRIIELVESTIGASGGKALQGIGMGSTGPVDPAVGTIDNPFTLPTWDHVNVKVPLEAHFHVPFTLENDADAAALGEYWQGAGQKVRRLYAITVGTGVGTAFILDGEIYRGIDGAHPEGGHMPVDPSGPLCYCGSYGCLESLASGPAIAGRYRHWVQSQPDLSQPYYGREDPEGIDTERIAAAALRGEPAAQKVMAEVAADFSRGLAAVVMLFAPDVIVLSGGVMKSAPLFMPAIEAQMAAIAVLMPSQRVQIVQARLGYHAGLYGAAYAAIQHNLALHSN